MMPWCRQLALEQRCKLLRGDGAFHGITMRPSCDITRGIDVDGCPSTRLGPRELFRSSQGSGPQKLVIRLVGAARISVCGVGSPLLWSFLELGQDFDEGRRWKRYCGAPSAISDSQIMDDNASGTWMAGSGPRVLARQAMCNHGDGQRRELSPRTMSRRTGKSTALMRGACRRLSPGPSGSAGHAAQHSDSINANFQGGPGLPWVGQLCPAGDLGGDGVSPALAYGKVPRLEPKGEVFLGHVEVFSWGRWSLHATRTSQYELTSAAPALFLVAMKKLPVEP
ncbi:hypothetical protein QBC39DRAFT_71998 [Podospora conica]|nr:hypothetical protein QBC39DRAFT_71998 [Schizothecium conicum]